LVKTDSRRGQLDSVLEKLRERIFLSYSSADRDIALWFKNQFRRDGYAVWRDGDTILVGANWRQELSRETADFEVLVVLLSPKSVESEYVQWEIEQFLAPGKHILSLAVSETSIPGSLKDCQVVDGSRDRNAAYTRLRGRLRQIL
jgi:MTH538 TIR-like domain (DUF1863).